MPLGSSSDAPVIRPGPSTRRILSLKVSGAWAALASRVAFEAGDGFMGKTKKKNHSKRAANLNPWRPTRFDGATLTSGTRSSHSTECLLVALNGHRRATAECPLSGLKLTLTNRCSPAAIYEFATMGCPGRRRRYRQIRNPLA